MEIWLIALAALVLAGLLLAWMARNKESVKRQQEQFKAAYNAGRDAYRDSQKS
jgi:hypothetical protein